MHHFFIPSLSLSSLPRRPSEWRYTRYETRFFLPPSSTRQRDCVPQMFNGIVVQAGKKAHRGSMRACSAVPSIESYRLAHCSAHRPAFFGHDPRSKLNKYVRSTLMETKHVPFLPQHESKKRVRHFSSLCTPRPPEPVVICEPAAMGHPDHLISDQSGTTNLSTVACFRARTSG